jgi:drug/metabolite transporter (DMT)-like permease
MGWSLLAIVVLASTAIWPVGRWALKEEGESAVVGFWVSLTVAVVCAIAVARSGEWHGAPAGVWWAGGTMGVAYAIGFWICTMRALQIGPAGPTVTVNNMALVAGVLYSMLVLTPGRAGAWTVVGLVGVCATLLLLGLGRPAEDGAHRATGALWARLIAIGGAFSCLSFMAQAHAGTLYPGHKYLFGMVVFGLSALLLLPPMLQRPARFRLRHERLSGLTLGMLNAGILPLSLTVIRQVGAEVALPITVAMPILLMLLFGRVFYHERLTPAAWIACVLGAASVAALAYGHAG